MKYAIILVIYLICIVSLHSYNVITEDFTTTTFPPTGWTMTGPSTTVWTRVATNFAGGAAGELQLNYSPSAVGIYRFISPVFNTEQVYDMNLQFRHMLDDYEYTTNTYTIGAQIYTPSAGWTTVWSVTTTDDIPASLVNVPISFELGKSLNTQIAFFFEGDNNDLDNWYIDNILLTYNNTLGQGIWTAGTYYPVGSMFVPDGYTLQIEADAELIFNSNCALEVAGRLLVNGTESQPVVFTVAALRDYWDGILFYNVNAANDSSLINHAVIESSTNSGAKAINSDKVRFSNCTFSNNLDTEGGGIYADHSDVVVENCDFYWNQAYYGAALYSYSCTPVIRNSRFYENTCEGNGSIVELYLCDVSGVRDNYIINNFCTPFGSAVSLGSSTGIFQRNIIANNNGSYGIYKNGGTVSLSNCDIVNNFEIGIATNSALTINNCIIYGNPIDEIVNQSSANNLSVSYSCLEGGIAGIGGNNMNIANYIGNTSDDPLFVSPTTGAGTGYNALIADWRLQYISPCIDTGDPASPLNPDGSREDMGMYFRGLKPKITRATDVAPDQGHSLYLRWDRSDIDVSYQSNAYYSIWRENNSRNENAVYVDNPTQLNAISINRDTVVRWRDGTRTWDFLVQVPALNFTDYGTSVYTVQDSSSTGTHAENYMVIYQNSNGFWDSIAQSGYSVDNIPPYAPARVDIMHTAGNDINLDWEPVTEGGWEGNSYPEVNLITYKVYAGDTPDFVISPATYLSSTINPFTVLTNQSEPWRFYKIIASDTE